MQDDPKRPFIPALLATGMRSKLSRLRRIIDTARSCLTWVIGSEVYVPDFGRLRIHVPNFRLPQGSSIIFLDTADENGSTIVNALPPVGIPSDYTWNGLEATPHILLSWKGMSVTRRTISVRGHIAIFATAMSPAHPCIVEIDFDSPSIGTLSLNREFLQLREAEMMSMS